MPDLSLFEGWGEAVTRGRSFGVTGLAAWMDGGASNMVKRGKRKSPLRASLWGDPHAYCYLCQCHERFQK